MCVCVYVCAADIALAIVSMRDIPYSCCVVHQLNLAAKEGNTVLSTWFKPLNKICVHMRKSCKATYAASTTKQSLVVEANTAAPAGSVDAQVHLLAFRDIVRLATDCKTRFISKCAVLDSLLKHQNSVTFAIRGMEEEDVGGELSFDVC